MHAAEELICLYHVQPILHLNYNPNFRSIVTEQ